MSMVTRMAASAAGASVSVGASVLSVGASVVAVGASVVAVVSAVVLSPSLPHAAANNDSVTASAANFALRFLVLT
jgi:hypothetical protein